VQKSLPLFAGKELEEPRHGLPKHRWVLIVEVRICQEARADRGVGIGGLVRLGMSTGLPAGMRTGLSE
jgi:hypothetical protein